PPSVATSVVVSRFAASDRWQPGRTDLCAAAAKESHPLHQKSSGQIPTVNCPLLTRALAIALGLVGITLAIFLYQILCVGSRNIRRTRATAIALFWSPRSRFHRLLNALRHEKTYEQKFETQAARRAQSLHQYSGFINTCKNNGSGRTRLSDKCPGGKISLR